MINAPALANCVMRESFALLVVGTHASATLYAILYPIEEACQRKRRHDRKPRCFQCSGLSIHLNEKGRQSCRGRSQNQRSASMHNVFLYGL